MIVLVGRVAGAVRSVCADQAHAVPQEDRTALHTEFLPREFHGATAHRVEIRTGNQFIGHGEHRFHPEGHGVVTVLSYLALDDRSEQRAEHRQ